MMLEGVSETGSEKASEFPVFPGLAINPLRNKVIMAWWFPTVHKEGIVRAP
jgi:hypothetical protein